MPKKKMKAKKKHKPKKAKAAKRKAVKKKVAKKRKAKPKKAKHKAKPKAKRPKAKAKTKAAKPLKVAAKPVKPAGKPKISTGPKPIPPSGGYPIGRVVHFYDKISVAIVTLTGKLAVGEKILFKRGDRDFVQKIRSIQVHHEPLQNAVAGQVVGLKVDKVAPEGMWLLRP